MERMVSVGGLEFFVVEAGPADGRPVLLLHGFPDSSDLWRAQIPVLAGAGYRVIADAELRRVHRRPLAVRAHQRLLALDPR